MSRYAVVLAVGVLACWQGPSERPPPVIPSLCGDGALASSEECDNGAQNSDTQPGACRTTCVLAACGDRVVDPNEVCDDGNRASGDGCAATCRKVERCGDGILDPGAEQCDEGVNNSDTRANRCRTTCTLPRCGDRVTDREEECDDGNVANADTCDSNCTWPRCGNGVTGFGEECDDANTFNTDSCRPDCQRNRCAGGVDQDGNACFVVRTLPLPDSDMRAVEIADLDGNGWADIAVVDRDDDTVKVYWNNGGSFALAEQWVALFYSLSGDRPVDLAVGDINADGKLDLVTANESQDRLCILENKGNRTFDRHFIDVAGQPTDVTLAPIDGSAGLELVVGLDDGKEVRVIRLNQFLPYGTSQALPATDPSSLSTGDADGDGDADICWSGGLPALALNESGGLVRATFANGQSTSATVRLWELDGAPPAELVAGVYEILPPRKHLRVFRNADTTDDLVFDTYADTSVKKWPVYLARLGSGVVYADNGGTFGVLRNEQGTLLDEQTFTYDGEAKGLASGDLDNDGAPEVVILSPDRQAVLVFFRQ